MYKKKQKNISLDVLVVWAASAAMWQYPSQALVAMYLSHTPLAITGASQI